MIINCSCFCQIPLALTLVLAIVDFYTETLYSQHWGEVVDSASPLYEITIQHSFYT